MVGTLEKKKKNLLDFSPASLALARIFLRVALRNTALVADLCFLRTWMRDFLLRREEEEDLAQGCELEQVASHEPRGNEQRQEKLE